VQYGSGPREALALQHVAVETVAMDPAEIFLEVVFRFWLRIGYQLVDDRPGVELQRPSKHDFGRFLREPSTVSTALRVWLRDGADLPDAAAVLPMLALWFRDPEERLPEEETHFFAQWWDYVERRS
jgi:hypothetical protein